MSNKKVIITLSFVKNLIKQLSDPNAEDSLKESKSYCFDIPTGKQIFFRDLKLIGFAIRATRHSLVYTVEKKMPSGAPCRVTIGDHGLYTPETARQKATEYLLEMSQGINPNDKKEQLRQKASQERHNHRQIPTVLNAHKHYIESKSELKPNTVAVYDRDMNLYLKDWHHLKIKDITMEMVVEKHAEISQTNKSHANITLKLFSAIYNYHRKRLTNNNQPLITEFSPVQILYQSDLFNKLKPRKGYINSEQQADWVLAIVQTQWRGHEKANEYGYLNQDFLLTFVLTGLRRSEVEQLAWANIDLKYGTLKIINPKNGDDLLLPLGDTLLHIFKQRKKYSNGCKYVFPATNNQTHIKDRRHVRHKIAETTGISFTFHDLRRTFTSIANRCGIGMYTVKALINHSYQDDSDITADYTQIDAKDLRDAMNKIENHILSEEIKNMILAREYSVRKLARK
ncbi:integrase family protein [Acinetobacter johnsonii]|uniref:Integrase family protein n=1 Tax=Acinetobacter johnsonii TaxID=40214 RepID=A0AA42QPH5_ACIJO|nr:tyrosine-type recombinase/integrase [Acinetobacter johnsonii]MDH1437952.1 integrase family protein [Acinetobacter johnsonii]